MDSPSSSNAGDYLLSEIPDDPTSQSNAGDYRLSEIPDEQGTDSKKEKDIVLSTTSETNNEEFLSAEEFEEMMNEIKDSVIQFPEKVKNYRIPEKVTNFVKSIKVPEVPETVTKKWNELMNREEDDDSVESSIHPTIEIDTTKDLRLPGSVKSVWKSLKNKKNEPDPDADGFYVIDKSQFAPPQKIRARRERATTTYHKVIERTPMWLRRSGVAIAVVLLLTIALSGSPLGQLALDGRDDLFVNWSKEYNVAFIGNSYLYVNDIPRLMESISEGHINQNSVINPTGSLSKLLRSGNGMNERWRNENAISRTRLDKFYYFIPEDYVLYDLGACSVYQLLMGYDNDLVYNNYNYAYYDDGTNPCFYDDYYLGLIAENLASEQTYWDFIVLNDQTKRMAFQEAREETIDALKYAYAPMIRETRAVPILVDTHAFWNEQSNMTGLADIAYFTAEIYEGLREYVLALKYNLPEKQAPRIAPIGLAYLTVYEENYELWERLFLQDQVHSSAAGSYLFANVLYATIYGHLPHAASAFGGVQQLFENARDVRNAGAGWPTRREVNYLRIVAKRVTLNGHVPSLLSAYSETIFHLENAEVNEFEMSYYSNGYDTSFIWDDQEEEVEEDRYQNEENWNQEQADEWEGQGNWNGNWN